MVMLSVLLFVNAAFHTLTWPTFFRRVVADPRARDDAGRVTRFFTVHLALFIAAMVIALASVLAGIAALTGQL
ncbi:SCO4848 family membrane protein [Microbacterium halotolerans]|uniref:SCO4848 family membrane protein n=1 Tax=Microbacterium halotolerans TaxID=246613 RepID=UPI000E6AD364|nr:hypothetical protein [Microbacterium halotolerans]